MRAADKRLTVRTETAPDNSPDSGKVQINEKYIARMQKNA
jgi:hypothetical protein